MFTITRVAIKLPNEPDERVLAYVSITIDAVFVVQDLRIVRGRDGNPFVAMPDKKVKKTCHRCQTRNVFDAKYCNECGVELEEAVEPQLGESVVLRRHMDVAHPITVAGRAVVEDAVLAGFALTKTAAGRAKISTKMKGVFVYVVPGARRCQASRSKPRQIPQPSWDCLRRYVRPSRKKKSSSRKGTATEFGEGIFIEPQ